MNDKELQKKISEYMDGDQQEFVKSFVKEFRELVDYIDNVRYCESRHLVHKYTKLNLDAEVLKGIMLLELRRI